MATAAQRFEAGQISRNNYLDRARTAGALTLPYLLPRSNDPGALGSDSHTLPWEGIGARGVLNLASRFLLALLPPTELFFRLTLNEAQVQKNGGITPEARLEVEQALVNLERQILRSIEASGDRLVLHEALLHLLVVGNVLAYLGEDGSRLFHLNRYVLWRDPMGHPMEAVTCEEVAWSSLSPKVIKLLEDESDEHGGEDEDDLDKTVRIYTRILWEGTRCRWWQEVCDHRIPGSEGRAPVDNCPWLPLRMTRQDGHPYSPGYVEMACLADLNTAEALSQSVVECASILAIVRFLVKPGGTTNAKVLAAAANGDFVPGDVNDVQALQTQKTQEMQAAMSALQMVEARLAQSFLLANPRDSERTTAQEIQLMAMELERGQGALYSILAEEFQRPYVKRRLAIETKRGGLPQLGKDLVQPVLTTGLNAVGRGMETQRLQNFLAAIAPLGEGAFGVVNMTQLVRMIANGEGISTLGLLKTDKQLAQERQQAMAIQAAQTAATSPMADPLKQAQADAINQQVDQQAQQAGAPPEQPAPEPTTAMEP